MAKIKTIDGIQYSRGAISKKREQGVDHFTNTRVKEFKDPVTGEVVAHGPNEMYLQSYRDYQAHPLTPAEQSQRTKWREACREASAIIRDSLPRDGVFELLDSCGSKMVDALLSFLADSTPRIADAIDGLDV